MLMTTLNEQVQDVRMSVPVGVLGSYFARRLIRIWLPFVVMPSVKVSCLCCRHTDACEPALAKFWYCIIALTEGTRRNQVGIAWIRIGIGTISERK